MGNSCISTKNFEDTRAVYSAGKPVEIFMVADTDDTTDRQRFQQAIETSNNDGSGFTHENVVLLYYYFMKRDIKRAESYIESSDWLKNKGTTIYPKNKKDNKCF